MSAHRPWMILDPQSRDLQPLRRTDYQREFATSDAGITLFAGGKGVGKSCGLLHLQDELLWDNPGQDHIFAAPTQALTDYFVNAYFRPAFAKLIIGEERGKSMIHLVGNRTFIYKTSGNLDALEAYTCASGSGDEFQLNPPLALAKLWARLRGGRRPRLGVACTPDSQWLKREFDGRDDKHRRCIHASVYDNPFVSLEWIETFASTIPATLRDAYLHGRFVTPGLAVYGADVGDRNVLPDSVVNGATKHVAWIDFGFRMPHVIFVALFEPGRLHPTEPAAVMYDEIVGFDLTSEALAMQIKNRAAKAIAEVACDPAGSAKDSRSGESDVIIMRSVLRCPFKFPHPQLRPIETGIMRTKTALNPTKGEPTLYLTESLKWNSDDRGVYNSLLNYSYPKDSEGKPISDVPIKDGWCDHAMDSMRYGVIVHLASRGSVKIGKSGGLK